MKLAATSLLIVVVQGNEDVVPKVDRNLQGRTQLGRSEKAKLTFKYRL